MRISFNATVMVSLFFSKLLLAAPLGETGLNFPKSITRLLELMPLKPSEQNQYHYACQTLNRQYGVKIKQPSGHIYCQYLNQSGELKLSSESIPLFPDKGTLASRVEEFLALNNETSQGYWDYSGEHLRYIHSQGSGKSHVLLPEDAKGEIESGSGSENENMDMMGEGYESGIDISATMIGAGIFILGTVFIAGVLIEANKHCVSTLLLAGYQKLAEIPFGRILECNCREWYWEWQMHRARS